MTESELARVQKRARVRCISMEDIDDAIFEIQSLIDGVIEPRELLSRDTAGRFIKERQLGVVGMTFKVNPESTSLYLFVGPDGIVQVEYIQRESCNSVEFRYHGKKEVNV